MFYTFFLWIGFTAVFCCAEGGAVSTGGEPPRIPRETPESVVYREADGSEVTLSKNPKRVVIAYGSLVGAWYLAGGTAVGITQVKSAGAIPEAARGVEPIGGIGSPNVEKILSLEPDLVLLMSHLQGHRALREVLARNRIETVMLEYENVSDFMGLVDLFCRLNGTERGTTGGDAVVADVREIVSKYAGRTGPRFLSMAGSLREFSAETSRANTARIAEMLGGRNIVTLITGPNPKETRIKLGTERILLEDPDVILFTTMGDSDTIRKEMEARFVQDEIWRNLRAVREKRVYFLPIYLFLYKPNERYPEAFRHLAERLYPDVTKE